VRLPDWPERLDRVIREARTRSFAYGTFDCALFAADCVQAVTGIDYAAELRGYESKTAAYRIVAKFGSLEAMITSLLNKPPVHPANAGRLAVVLANIEIVDGEEGESMGFLTDAYCRFPIAKGLRKFTRSIARLAWSIE